jgi:hypothetical protein
MAAGNPNFFPSFLPQLKLALHQKCPHFIAKISIAEHQTVVVVASQIPPFPPISENCSAWAIQIHALFEVPSNKFSSF